MKSWEGNTGGQFHALQDFEVRIEVGEVEREDADDLRGVMEIGKPECRFRILSEAIEDDLHQLEWFTGAIGDRDPQAEPAAL